MRVTFFCWGFVAGVIYLLLVQFICGVLGLYKRVGREPQVTEAEYIQRLRTGGL